MKRLVLWTLLCAGIFSCSKDGEFLPEQTTSTQPTKSYLISMDSVRRIAAKLPALYSDRSLTRSSESGQVAEIKPLNRFIPNITTKSATNDVSQIENIFVVNYANASGFALISADTRLDQVLAYSDKGDFEETLDNPAIRGLVSNIPGYIENQIALRRIEDSIIGPEPSGEYCVDHYNYFGPETTTKGPFITTRWGQLWPFNQYHASALYGPTIAVVQLMAYYNWPLSMQNYESQSITVFNWPEDRGYVFGPILQMYPEAVERVSRACHKVVNLLLENEGESHGVTVEAIKNTYGEYGYIADKMESYSSSSIRTDLDKARPVLMSGYSSTNWWDGDMGTSGWIVDGYKDTYSSYQLVRTWYNAQNEVIVTEYFPVVPTSTKLLHINWGWDGRGDGYFLDGLFAPMQGDSYDFPTLGTTDDHHYRYTVKQLVNYRRQHDPK